MDDRQDLFEQINRLRAEVGLSPYDASSLNRMTDRELQGLLEQSLAFRKSYGKTSGRKIPLVLVSIAFVAIIIIGAVIYYGQLSQEGGTGTNETPENTEIACMCDEKPDICDYPECDCDSLCPAAQL